MRAIWLSAGLLVAFSAPLSGHETGTIRLASKTVPVGGELVLRGEKLPKRATLRLQLRGALETFPLGEVRTDSLGVFNGRLALPTEARAGSYSVVVLAPDNDVAARAPLTVTPPAAAEMSPMEHATMDSTARHAAVPHATADMMDVPTATTPGEWAAILGIIAASLVGGVALLVGARRAGT